MMAADIKKTGNNVLDIAQLKLTVGQAYNDAIEACREYTERQNIGKSAEGQRRMNKVRELARKAQLEKEQLLLGLDNLMDSNAGIWNNDVTKIRDVLRQVRSVEVKVGNEEWQKEGNSTDVYKVKVESKGDAQKFYLKENLKMISDDLPGYLERRIRQLMQVLRKKQRGQERKRNDSAATRRLKRNTQLPFDYLTLLRTRSIRHLMITKKVR